MELVRKTVRIPPDLNKCMKIAAIELGISEQELMERALNQFLGGNEMNRETAIGTMFDHDTIDNYDWADTYPMLNDAGRIIAVVPADDCSRLALVGDKFVCRPEHAEQLAKQYGIPGGREENT